MIPKPTHSWGEAQAMKATRPPLRSTRNASRRKASGSGKWGMPKFVINGIKAVIWERKRTRIGFVKLKGWVMLPGKCQLCRRKINPDHRGAALGRCSCGIAEACRDVRDLRTGPNRSSIQ